MADDNSLSPEHREFTEAHAAYEQQFTAFLRSKGAPIKIKRLEAMESVRRLQAILRAWEAAR
jgi:hypothetical protein